MAPDTTQEYQLPPLSELLPPEPLSSWNPFDRHSSSDRTEIRYEPAPSVEEQSGQHVGLGITQPADYGSHSRSESYDDTAAALGDHERVPSRVAHSQTTLLDDHPHPVHNCPTKKTIVQRRLSWVPLTVLVLAVYSTLLSGLYLVVALIKPRYGKIVGVDGNLAPATASLLSTLFAKTIELAYVTVCVAFLGQVLTRRAITKGSRGISIADMSMRSWIMQPGSLIVHWESLRYSGWTILGAITLTATLVAMLYTTAAEALVTPKLIMGPVESRMLEGDVHTSFANTDYLGTTCETPIAIGVDSNRNLTCVDMEYAGQAYHNYQAFLHAWSQGTPSRVSTPGARPLPTGSIHDNTTLTGSWIDQANMTELSQRYGRIVHNITAAMPHGGIIAAASKRANGIQQPKDNSGEGNYELEASVPSPAVNVLCAAMTAHELTPLVYNLWPNTEGKFNPVNWTASTPDNVPGPADWRNRTVVDDLFEFGPDYPGRPSPVFGKLPKPYNTILNVTGPYTRPAIYLLGAAPENTKPEYVLCSLQAKQTPRCSTYYKVAYSGSQLRTICDEGHSLQYNLRVPDVLDGIWQRDWKYIASEWAMSLSLNTGITDGQSSNARLLMQFIPKTASLDPNLPSISEALAVLAGNTLLMSTTDAPFVPFWNYTENILSEPVTQSFNATLRSVEYASGGTQRWQGVFYPILVFAFITSALCLTFMVLEVRGKQITDFTEPQNLFALAMNSPSTARLQGACGAGPDGRQLKERFYVAMEEEDEHYYIRTKAEEHTPRVSTAKLSTVSLDLEEPSKSASPAMDEYRRLSSRRSWLSRYY